LRCCGGTNTCRKPYNFKRKPYNSKLFKIGVEDDEEEDREYSFDDMSEVLAMAAPVINVHLIKRLEVGLGDVTTLIECTGS
jgi:hypothetical protein